MAIKNGTDARETLDGTDSDDTLNGFGGNDILNGFGGNDTLNGGDGDDLLDGGTGSDLLQGGNGSDIYYVDNLGDQIVENSDAENSSDDRVYSSVTWTLGANLETLSLTGNDAINGTGNALDNFIVGNDASNLLSGGDGNDSLNGVSGSDTLNGGAGNDFYFVDANDTINEDPNGGTDSISSVITWTLGANLENLYLWGVDAIDGIGNELDNIIRGNVGRNTLFGREGNDRLIGLGESDTLNGGTGDDTYVVREGDVINEDVDAGIDTVESKISFTLGENLENLTLYKKPPFPDTPSPEDDPLKGIGNQLDNTITGNNASNVLSGKQGNDTLLGEGGDDRIVGGIGEDTLTGGDGADRFYRWRSNTGVDTITDFQVGGDLLCFSARGFGGDLVRGSLLAEEQFTLGSAATTDSQRFIYDDATGALFFDADGTGESEQVQLATLSSGLALGNADIFIF